MLDLAIKVDLQPQEMKFLEPDFLTCSKLSLRSFFKATRTKKETIFSPLLVILVSCTINELGHFGPLASLWRFWLGITRDFARPMTFRYIRAFCRLHRPNLIFLIETKISPFSSSSSLSLGFPFMIHSPFVGCRGGLVVAWKPRVDVEQINQSPSQISCLVYSNPVTQPWLLTCSYAPHNGSKVTYWNLLSDIGNSFTGPWLNLGDFNTILFPCEKLGGRSFGSPSYHDFVGFVHINAWLILAL